MSRPSPRWLFLFVLVWWVLAGSGVGAWAAGGVAVLGGAVLHGLLGGGAGSRVRPLGALRFLPYFLRQAFRGGVDVARRALTPAMPLAPAFLRYRLELPEGPPRVFFVCVVSLLPGTFSAELHGREVIVHILAPEIASEGTLGDLERRVAALFTPPGR